MGNVFPQPVEPWSIQGGTTVIISDLFNNSIAVVAGIPPAFIDLVGQAVTFFSLFIGADSCIDNSVFHRCVPLVVLFRVGPSQPLYFCYCANLMRSCINRSTSWAKSSSRNSQRSCAERPSLSATSARIRPTGVCTATIYQLLPLLAKGSQGLYSLGSKGCVTLPCAGG